MIRIGGLIIIRKTPDLGDHLMPGGMAKKNITKLKPPEFLATKGKNKSLYSAPGTYILQG
jgi:hypothetical protein